MQVTVGTTSYSDFDRSSDYQNRSLASEQSYTALRRPEVRQNRAFFDRGTEPVRGDQVCDDLSGRAEDPSYVREDVLERNHIPYRETNSLEDAMPELDICI
jgi:hypothetical protein